MKTAEWQCSKCATTNRKLVQVTATEAIDKCVSCKSKHKIAEDGRPVRWNATAS